MHNLTFTSLEMTVQSICSKCVNMPFRVESKVLMVNPIYRVRLHHHRASHWVERCVVFGLPDGTSSFITLLSVSVPSHVSDKASTSMSR